MNGIAREISGDMMVTARCVAWCEIAASLANRFGIIVGRRKWLAQMNAVVHDHGYGRHLAGFHHVELGVNDFQRDHAETRRRLVAAGRGGGRSRRNTPMRSSSAAPSRSASTASSRRSWGPRH